MRIGKWSIGEGSARSARGSAASGPVGSLVARALIGLLVVYLLICVVIGWYWSREPDLQPVSMVRDAQTVPVVGELTATTVAHMMSTLLNKPGGFITNDVTPPGLWLDNMPHWEFGVLVQIRDMTRAMRRDMARSQSQSAEDRDLARAEPLFHFDNTSWAFPATESEYATGLDALEKYTERLRRGEADFYARADNLASWMGDVNTRLGSLSQRLSASVDQGVITDGSRPREKTPWTELDDVFFEARGSAWALVHLLRAVEVDFAEVIGRKNAQASLQQIIRELEATQEPLWSPVILNGGGFGMLANHSLVMANYLSRANAALIDLRRLLEQG
ncbi:DUF2333 family protein [Halopseudomonas pelagia]|uniref:DUF2333 family protein n=1 Tax=Halopseudomonas pelagia TaxID=553151 RepID=UPI0003B77D51|nr:DUF2333 family protein [Halopseudomonas pelagia]